ncbi:MAG: aminopeptidase P family protein [Bdellovibrionales bacterium]|nr:aminopeptidase P family protein [Bdellovibrionales bacterium]
MEIKNRLKKINQLMEENSCLIVGSAQSHIRNKDVSHPFRQDSCFYYLTQFNEEKSALVLRPGKKPESILFLQKKNPTKELWEGELCGIQKAKSQGLADEVYDIEDFCKLMPSLLSQTNLMYYSFGKNTELDKKIKTISEKILESKTDKEKNNLLDAKVLFNKLRSIKSETEISYLQKAADISALGHIAIMKSCKPEINERELYGIFLNEIMKHGSDREAYRAIVAGGSNATCLHYTSNNSVCKNGDLLTVDAGAEYKYYAGDVTRVMPISGKFSNIQKEVYSELLKIQKELIGFAKINKSLKEMQNKAVDKLSDMMINLKLFKQSKSEIIEKKLYKKYYPHGVSHWLGSDVHDDGPDTEYKFQKNMCITVEPGIYIPLSDTCASKELRGMGLRIEDDVVITGGEALVLSAKAPKEIAEIESLMQK